jgi:hypothetical protein
MLRASAGPAKLNFNHDMPGHPNILVVDEPVDDPPTPSLTPVLSSSPCSSDKLSTPDLSNAGELFETFAEGYTLPQNALISGMNKEGSRSYVECVLGAKILMGCFNRDMQMSVFSASS